MTEEKPNTSTNGVRSEDARDQSGPGSKVEISLPDFANVDSVWLRGYRERKLGGRIRPPERARTYRHLDLPVTEEFAKGVLARETVKSHSFTPLLHFVKSEIRYKKTGLTDPKTGKASRARSEKNRDIMYASHRDACIYDLYSQRITSLLNALYVGTPLDTAVVAYRKTGRANYDIALDVCEFARSRMPCTLLCFDVENFFGTLDHRLLKLELKKLLGTIDLADDWYKVYRSVTKYHRIELADLETHAVFGKRLKGNKSGSRIATIAEIRAAGITIHPNPNPRGIPQGTPISATLSNLYMLPFDTALTKECEQKGALYRRYSDDILVVCDPADAEFFIDFVLQNIKERALVIQSAKTERTEFDIKAPRFAQYLGFLIGPTQMIIRESSLSRAWRKFHRTKRRTWALGKKAVRRGTTDQIKTKHLHDRFTASGKRNFSHYARRAAKILGSEDMVKQIRRLENRTHAEIRKIRAFNKLNRMVVKARPGASPYTKPKKP